MSVFFWGNLYVYGISPIQHDGTHTKEEGRRVIVLLKGISKFSSKQHSIP